MSLKAVTAVPASRSLEIRDIAPPRLSTPDDVLVRVLEVGICGTDKEIARFEYGDPPPGSDYLVIGHECLGEIEQTGEAVENFKPGDLVVPTVRRPCNDPACSACRNSRQDFCFTGNYRERGIKELHGFMSGGFVEQSRYLHKIPNGLRDVGVLTEPLTIARKALRQVFDIQDRLPWACSLDRPARGNDRSIVISCRRALVLGAGPVGLLGAMTFAHAGFETLIYSNQGSVPQRRSIAAMMGVRFIAAEEVSSVELPAHVGKIDVVYEAVGASQLAFDMLSVLGANAVFVFTGVPGRKTQATIDTNTIMRNLVLQNQALVGTVNAASEDFESAIASLQEFRARWPGALEQMKTGLHEPEEVPDLLRSKAKGVKNVVKFQ